MRKIVSFLFFIFVFCLAALGQQDPQYTNNMFYKLGVNPGIAGSQDAIRGIILNRYQWTGFEGAPKTMVFSADAPVMVFGAPSGIGLNMINDKLGPEENVWVNLNYAYMRSLRTANLGIGLSLGVFNKSIKGEWEVPDDDLGIYIDPASDPAIPQGEASQVVLDAGLGLYLEGVNYYAGISVTHLNQPAVKFSDLATTYLARHYYLTGGYNIKLPDPLIELRPSFLLKSDLAGWQLDVNANLVFNNRFWGGVSYRLQDAVSLLFGMELINGLSVGYSFDLTTSAIGRYGYGSHEVFLSYSLNVEKNRSRKYKSVRFL
ncbi:MAG TPA: type IX secretion system membrane protein PorP/SprF [Prolixibacteraceae bacterium]|nr:type IX secretion system membrane protein PorP/SprF [Prolixibacteraceae bacterium]